MKSTLFQNKSIIYEQYRPDYPGDLIQILKLKSFLKDDDCIAEFGCGTGKLTTLLLNNGNKVYGVEPDDEMFDYLQKKFSKKQIFCLYNTNAENSCLPGNSFDVIISAQAFHLFDVNQARDEFYRIIKKGGYILLLWYFVDKNNSIAKEIRSLFYRYGKQNYQKRQKINFDTLQEIFYPNSVTYQIISQFEQKYSNREFINSMLSSSYAPNQNNSDYVNRAQSIFDKYSGQVDCIAYDFQIHLYAIQIN